MSSVHPALVLFLTAAAVLVLRGLGRRIALMAGTGLALVAWGGLDFDASVTFDLRSYELSLLRVDPLSLVFGLVFTLITFVGSIYALHVSDRGETAATLVYGGSALGVVFAGDWITLFVFWELMAVSSLFVIWQGKTRRADAAGHRYLLVHVTGGSLLFFGILVHVARGGSIAVAPLTSEGISPLAFWLVLLGVAVNAAVPPLHAWLTDAYPEASVTGSVFLSAFTTKTAVYVLVRVFPGAEVLVTAGVVMALYGVVYAVLENDIRRLLAYHIISQVGYMVAGVGMGTELALDGTTAHAYSHILYKSLLFMGAGAVIYQTGGLRKLTELGGIASNMKLVVILYTVGAFSISGVPLFNGFISKSMVISAATESHRPLVELLLTLASVGTFLHTGLKLPYFTFFGERRDVTLRPLPMNMLVGMGVGAALCTVYGIYPSLLYGLLPHGSDYHPYTFDHVVSSLQLLAGTALAFYLLLAKLGGEATVSVDTDWLYRRPFARLVASTVGAAAAAGAGVQRTSARVVASAYRLTSHPMGSFDLGHDPRSEYDPYRFPFPIGVTFFWVAVYFAIVAAVAMLRIWTRHP